MNEGGITVSGGEPLLQIDFLTELFKKAKENGIHTTLDTSGNPFTREEPFFSKFNELMQYTDLILLDIKHIDEKEHIRLTGHTNKNILDLATYLSDMKKPVRRICSFSSMCLMSSKMRSVYCINSDRKSTRLNSSH